MSTNYNEDQSAIDTDIWITFSPAWPDIEAHEPPANSNINNDCWPSQTHNFSSDSFNFTHVDDSWPQICQLSEYPPNYGACIDVLPLDPAPFEDWGMIPPWEHSAENPMSQATCSSDTGISDFPLDVTSPSGLSTMAAIPSPLTHWEYQYPTLLPPTLLPGPSSSMPFSPERLPNAHETGLLLSNATSSVIPSPRAVPIPPAKPQIIVEKNTRRKGRRRVKEFRRDKRKREKPAECPFCKKRFQYLRERHLRIHKQDREKYPCHICPKEFSEKFNRDRHVKHFHS